MYVTDNEKHWWYGNVFIIGIIIIVLIHLYLMTTKVFTLLMIKRQVN